MSTRFIGNNVLRGATITSETTLAGFPASNMVDGCTNTQTGFSGGAARQVVFDLGVAKTISGFGIAKHNLGTTNGTINVEYSSNGTTWTSLLNTFAGSDNPQFFTGVTSVSRRYVRVTVTTSSANTYISDLTVGEIIDTGVSQPVGFTNPEEAFKDDVIANVTRGNELAGMSIINRPKEFKISIDDVRYGTFDTMAAKIYDMVRAGPFYFNWANLSGEGINARTAFCWIKKMPTVKWSGQRIKSMQLDCMGFTE